MKTSYTHSQGLAALLGVVLALTALGLFAYEAWQLPSLIVFDRAPIGTDFSQFWTSARLILMGHSEGPYLTTVMSDAMRELQLNLRATAEHPEINLVPLYYPPVYLLLITPFGLMPYFIALLCFFAFGALFFFTAIWKLTRERWIFLFMLGFAGVWLNLSSGQNGLLTAGLVGLALYHLPRHAALAGLFIGLTCYKPHLGLLWPLVLLAAGYYRVFFFAALTVIALIAYTLIVFGLETWIVYSFGAEFSFFILEHQQNLWIRMPTLYALLRLQMIAFDTSLLIQILFSLSMAWLVVRIWRRTDDFAWRGASLALGILLATPFIYDYDYAILGIALVLLLQRAGQHGWTWADRILLPLAFVWPVLLNTLPGLTKMWGLGTWQVGFMVPLALLLVINRRVAVAGRPAPALQQAV